MPKTATDIDRIAASKLLKVSVRTIDRYIRRGMLRARQENGRIWLNKKDLHTFPQSRQIIPVKIVKVASNTRTPSPVTTREPDEHFYRDLYEEARKALHDYQQKLEHSNYRIGQLESQTAHPLSPQPILQKHFEHREEGPDLNGLRRELADREKEIILLQELVKKEKANRIVFAFLTYLLLLLQPVFWYLLQK